MNRREDKIVEIERYLSNLEYFLPDSFEEYISDGKSRMACERCCEKIIEAVIDLVFIIIKEKKLRSPDSNKDALDILSDNGTISLELSRKLGDAKSMRNWLAHRYGEVNDEFVFHSLKDELLEDVKELLEAIE